MCHKHAAVTLYYLTIVDFNSTASYFGDVGGVCHCNYIYASTSILCNPAVIYNIIGIWFYSYAKAVMEAPRSSTLPSRSTEVKANPQQVLDSLFKIPEMRTYEPSSMDWKKVVKKLQSFNSTATSNNQERPKAGMQSFV